MMRDGKMAEFEEPLTVHPTVVLWPKFQTLAEGARLT